MTNKSTLPMSIDDVQFDKFGRYDVTEIVLDSELDLVSGGVTIIGQINVFYCAGQPTPPPPPAPNQTCGEDGDDEY
ncbi:hypothetical protein [Pseudomonas chlororaphis]|uniref:hypothetical protein n=1 Tax=Pseudomonas chlororaphis TaxID=587753 RepID=UPI00117A07BA|nr:hypothetical protein [Pseudomonas chlororaphis]